MADSLEKQLFRALKGKNNGAAKKIIEQMGDYVNNIYKGRSPLSWAKKFKNEEISTILASKGAQSKELSVENQKELGGLLFQLLDRGAIDKVVETIDYGADLDVKNGYGETILMYAIKCRNPKVVKLLIENGVRIDEKDSEGRSLLFLVAELNDADVMKTLLDSYSKRGITIDKDAQGDIDDALFMAAGRGNIELVDLLLKAGGNPCRVSFKTVEYPVDEWGDVWETRTDVVRKSAVVEAANNGNIELVKMLLAREDKMGIDVQEDIDEALVEALKCDNVEMFDLLLKKNIYYTKGNTSGLEKLLLRACVWGRSDEYVKKLLEAGADVNCKDGDGYTPLMEAVRCGKTKIVELLVENGAKVDAVNNEGRRAIDFCNSKNGEIFKMLLARGAEEGMDVKGYIDEALLKSIEDGDVKKFDLLMTEKIRYAQKTKKFYATDAGISRIDPLELDKLMLEACVSRDNNEVFVEKLLKAGADVNCKDENGNTPLMRAIRYGKTEIIDLLVENGAKVSAKNNNGESAISIADKNIRKVIFNALEKRKGTKLNIIEKTVERAKIRFGFSNGD